MTDRQRNRILNFYHSALKFLEHRVQSYLTNDDNERLTIVENNGGRYAKSAYADDLVISMLKEHRAIVREIRLLSRTISKTDNTLLLEEE